MSNEFLSVEDIEKVEDIITEEIEVPEWKGKILMKGLTAEEIYKITEKSKELNEVTKQMEINYEKFDYLRLVYSIITPDLSDKDFLILRNKSGGVIKRLLYFSELLSSGIKIFDRPETEKIELKNEE